MGRGTKEDTRRSSGGSWTGIVGQINVDVAEPATEGQGQDDNHLHPRKSEYSGSLFLNEGMQSWMKRTDYSTNDCSRKVHDFNDQ